MWLALCSFLFSLPPLAGLLLALRVLARGAAHRRWTGREWAALAALAALLTGRHWVRRLRPAAGDDPKPLTPTRRGWAVGRGGVRLEWEQFGPDDAPALLFSHGWSLSHDTWYYQKVGLAGEFRVIVWNMRGTADSDAPADRDYSLDALVEDLAAVFDATDAGRHPAGCVLAGHSVGAMLLPPFAVRCPERMARVRGLALLAGTDIPMLQSMRGRGWLVPLQKPFWEPLGRLMGRLPAPFEWYDRLIWHLGAIHLALMFGLHVDHESRGQDDLVARHCAHFSMRAAGLGALTCFRYDARDCLPHIEVPVLLLTGECDPNMPPEVQRGMAARLRHPELCLIPDCGHLSLLECHDQVNAELTAFAHRCLAG